MEELSFADGHAETWHWKVLNQEPPGGQAVVSTNGNSLVDLLRVQNAIFR